MSINRILLVLIAIGLAACAPAPVDVATATDVAAPAASSTVANMIPSRERIKTIEDYVVYYGQGRVDELARYDLAIVQPDTLTPAELAQLKTQGTLVVAYLSVGEAEPNRAWYNDGRVDLQWLLGKNEDWGSYYVDAGQPGWQQLMADLTGEFVAAGFDGVFLDTVDTVDLFPATKPGMITLIHGLRAVYPDALLVQNRGFGVAQEVATDLDAIMFEDLATTYNFATSTYDYVDNSATAEEMVNLQRQTGLPILALDYAPTDNPAMAYLATQLARKYGFIPAVSTINLDDIPDYGLDQNLPAEVPAPQSPQNWGNPTGWNNLIFQGEPTVTPRQVETTAQTTAAIERDLSPLNQLPAAGLPSDVTAIIGYSFDPGDISRPITPELLEQARATVRRAAAEGALWLDADTGITNVADAFIYDPALTYYPLAEAIIDEAHQAGVKVFFYFSATEIETPDFAAQSGPAIHKLHPDWLQVDQFGQPMVFEPGQLDFFWLEEGTADARMNPLAPGFFEALAVRSEKLAQLGADGLFYDVGYFFTIDNRWADFSPTSAATFKAATGHNLPVNLSADGRVYYEWLEWRHQVWANFYAGLRERVQRVNPNTLIIVEEYPGANPEGIIKTGLDPAIVERGVDVATHEYDHKQDEGGAIAYDRGDWQHTRDVYKWYQGMNRVNWSLCYATQAEDSRALAAISYAHQQSFWETKVPTMLDESAGPEWRQDLLNWLARHGDALNGVQPAAEVAVLYSNRTRNLTYASSLDELVRVQHALDKSGLPYVILTEPNINQIHKFPYLILAGVTYITPAVQAEIERYSGELLLVGDSFTRDGWNESDLEPPVESFLVNEAVGRISTTPLEIEGGEGLYVELFRRGNGVQIRLFNPNLNDDFMPEPRPITLRFTWPGSPDSMTQLDFMADAPVELPPVQNGEIVEVTTTAGLMSIITIGE